MARQRKFGLRVNDQSVEVELLPLDASPDRFRALVIACGALHFLEAVRAEKSDVTLQALCDRLSAERGVKADTSMMSRFFRRIGVTVKKKAIGRPLVPAIWQGQG
jgi:hypothetical protein